MIENKKMPEVTWDYFDFEWFKRKYPEVKELFSDKDSDIYNFYIENVGKFKYSPNPYFCESWYVRRYPGVKIEIEEKLYISGFDHYRSVGFRHFNPHWLFNEEYYVTKNETITDKIGDNKIYKNGYEHYLSEGDKDFLSGSWFFDPLAYVQSASDTVITRPFSNYMVNGKTRFPSVYFDFEWYSNKYPDVKKDIENGLWESELHHFLENDSPSNYDPSEYFLESYYIETNSDIKDEIITGRFRSGYEHFLLYGVKERRRPSPNVDIESYFHDSYIQELLQNGKFPDVFAAYCYYDGARFDIEKQLNEAENLTKLVYMKENRANAITIAKNKLDFTYKIPSISVIMVVHNQFEMTVSALAHLRASFEKDIQLIIVDSGSTDETKNIEHYIKGSIVHRALGNIGFINGINETLKYVLSPFCVLLNNDTKVHYGSISQAIRRIKGDPKIGAVGAKLIRTNGLLQEAGSIIWRDGGVMGYMRDQSPDIPEANFVRRVDFCSGAFLLVRTSLIRHLGGLDKDYAPAYYEETDLCVKIWEIGYEVVYDPDVIVTHYEYGTSSLLGGSTLINKNRPIFRAKHADFLSKKQLKSQKNITRARSIVQNDKKRILFIDDRIPLSYLGSGFSRANDIISCMSELGHEVTVFPIFKPLEWVGLLYTELPDNVEIMWNLELSDLEKFLTDRNRYYDIIWISRIHNVDRLHELFQNAAHIFNDAIIVADTEAISSIREYKKNEVLKLPQSIDLNKMIVKELQCLPFANRIVAVNQFEADLLVKYNFKNIFVLGHMADAVNLPDIKWQDREGVLFVGSIHDYDSPNYDSLVWFCEKIWPSIYEYFDFKVNFYIAGYIREGIQFPFVKVNSGILVLGKIDNLAELYNRCRVFVVPTRYAAGIPYKLHEAASNGIPIVATDIISNQVGWAHDEEIMSVPSNDEGLFSEKIIKLYENENIWNKIRMKAFEKIKMDHNKEAYKIQIDSVVS